MKTGEYLLQKYNPYHDAHGRFTSSGSAHFVSTKIRRAGTAGATAQYHDVGAKMKAKHRAKNKILDVHSREPEIGREYGAVIGMHNLVYRGNHIWEQTKNGETRQANRPDITHAVREAINRPSHIMRGGKQP